MRAYQNKVLKAPVVDLALGDKVLFLHSEANSYILVEVEGEFAYVWGDRDLAAEVGVTQLSPYDAFGRAFMQVRLQKGQLDILSAGEAFNLQEKFEQESLWMSFGQMPNFNNEFQLPLAA